jgi:hypothetical protein
VAEEGKSSPGTDIASDLRASEWKVCSYLASLTTAAKLNHYRLGLGDSRSISHERSTPYVAGLVGRKRPATVHRRPVVPHDKVTHGPLVRIDELALGCYLSEVH